MRSEPVVLVDTGPLVAFLDRHDPAHAFVASRWPALRGRFVTTGAVLTEAMHFLGPVPQGPEVLVDLFRRRALLLEDMFRPECLERSAMLMMQYADTPMDFADATLVVLAEELQTANILTLDERGFRVFRFGRTRPFRLLLQDQP